MDVNVSIDGGDEFEGFLGRLSDQVKDGLPAERAVRALAIEFTGRVIKKTPVDTGRARGGWSVWAKDNNVPIPVEDFGGGDEATGREESMADDNLNVHSGARDRFVRMTNGVPYIVPLEHGHSDQAPAGMVRVSLRELTTDESFWNGMRRGFAGGFFSGDWRGPDWRDG